MSIETKQRPEVGNIIKVLKKGRKFLIYVCIERKNTVEINNQTSQITKNTKNIPKFRRFA